MIELLTKSLPPIIEALSIRTIFPIRRKYSYLVLKSNVFGQQYFEPVRKKKRNNILAYYPITLIITWHYIIVKYPVELPGDVVQFLEVRYPYDNKTSLVICGARFNYLKSLYKIKKPF